MEETFRRAHHDDKTRQKCWCEHRAFVVYLPCETAADDGRDATETRHD